MWQNKVRQGGGVAEIGGLPADRRVQVSWAVALKKVPL